MPLPSLPPIRGTDATTITRLGAAEAARQQKLLQVPGATGQYEPSGRTLPPAPQARGRQAG